MNRKPSWKNHNSTDWVAPGQGVTVGEIVSLLRDYGQKIPARLSRANQNAGTNLRINHENLSPYSLNRLFYVIENKGEVVPDSKG